MNDFFIGNDNFGIGDFTCLIDHEKQIIEKLEINSNKLLFNKITEDEDGDWSWSSYPPKLYIRNTPYKISNNKITLIIDEDVLDDYDIALYFMEHFDIEGALTINEKNILEFKGTCYIDNEEYSLVISLNLNE